MPSNSRACSPCLCGSTCTKWLSWTMPCRSRRPGCGSCSGPVPRAMRPRILSDSRQIEDDGEVLLARVLSPQQAYRADQRAGAQTSDGGFRRCSSSEPARYRARHASFATSSAAARMPPTAPQAKLDTRASPYGRVTPPCAGRSPYVVCSSTGGTTSSSSSCSPPFLRRHSPDGERRDA